MTTVAERIKKLHLAEWDAQNDEFEDKLLNEGAES